MYSGDCSVVDEASDLIKHRIEKINILKEKGINPYPVRYKREDVIQKVRDRFCDDEIQQYVNVAGRLKSIRMMGKASFADLEDLSGVIQIYVKKDTIGNDNFEVFKMLDLGDIVGVKGSTFRTKQGEITISVEEIVLLSKSIRPLPVVKEKDGQLFDEFADREMRYRKRYVDLAVNQSVKRDFILRSRLIAGVREFLLNRSYIEVETPMMQVIPGGAAARPFITHHNTLDIDLYLRVAPELYLKRLLVGGFEKVFELNRNFRNEGISTKHNPEFTMLELYEAYADYSDMMNIAEEMISTLSENLIGKMIIDYQGNRIDLTPPWERITYIDVIKKHTGADFGKIESIEEAISAASSLEIEIKENLSIWKIADEIFDAKVENKLIQPTLVTDYPKELSPLSKSNEENPDFVERFEPYIAGREIGNAFTELNDPFDQRERFEEQVRLREAGDEEAQMMDYDYLSALEYGMPPAGGMGIGIDRLMMLFVDAPSIKDTILFPLLRPEK
ncbi:MAG: lysine--tRNA ligase [Spirochaetota bacterium]|nr:lysine--tRNA ligase [Spirochaetota bacterium]